MNIHQASGSSEGADFKSKVPDEPKGRSIDTSEGTSLKLGVPDVSKDVQDSEDEPQHADDERTGSENKETNDDEEETEDEFVNTPPNYVPTDDETNDESNDVTKEEYERINEELYGDANVSLTNVEPADKEKDDEEMTVAGHVNVNHEGASNQVNDDAQATQKTEVPLPIVSMMDINVQHEVPHTSSLLTIPVYVIPEQNVIYKSEIVITTPSPTISSLISSLYPTLQQITPIPTPTTTEATTSTIIVPDSEALAALQLRVTDLEKDVKELKDVDNSTKVISTIKSEVPNAVKEYLGLSLNDAQHKVIQKNFAHIIKEHSIPAETVETQAAICTLEKH
ncbi:hypothetical protein Tco_0723279 [Tanacetum coccineum]